MRSGWKLFFVLALTLSACGRMDSNGSLNAGEEVSSRPKQPPTHEDEISSELPFFVDSTEIRAARWEAKRSGSRNWTVALFAALDSLGQGLLTHTPSDIKNYCPRFSLLTKSDKKNFWIYLISSIAQHESTFDPNLKYEEDFADSSGRNVVSRGLLQLSIESANAYGCRFKTESSLHDPIENLKCGVRILEKWVTRDKVIRAGGTGAWRGGARYWSVLRRTEQAQAIRSWTSSQSYCK